MPTPLDQPASQAPESVMDLRGFVLALTAAGVAISLYLNPPLGASLLGGLTALTCWLGSFGTNDPGD